MDKLQCPKCKAKKGFWKWVTLKDLLGRIYQCPNCKMLFSLKSETHPFMNKAIWSAIIFAFLGGGVGLGVTTSIILLLEAIFDNKLLILVILILTSYPAVYFALGYLGGMTVNKFYILEHKKT